MTMGPDVAIAIVGYGGVFPGGADPERFWANILEGLDAITEVPPGRWVLSSSKAFDPRIPQPDKVYATRGGFIPDLPLDLLRIGPASGVAGAARPPVPTGRSCGSLGLDFAQAPNR